MIKKIKKKSSVKNTSSLYLPLQVEAIFNAITQNPVFFERKVRRWYSKNFNTPLKDTFKLPWDDILIHYYESTLEDRAFNELYDIAVDNYLPEFMNRKEQEDAAFAEKLVKEQQQTLNKKKAKVSRKGKKTEDGANTKPHSVPKFEAKEVDLNFKDDDFSEDRD